MLPNVTQDFMCTFACVERLRRTEWEGEKREKRDRKATHNEAFKPPPSRSATAKHLFSLYLLTFLKGLFIEHYWLLENVSYWIFNVHEASKEATKK